MNLKNFFTKDEVKDIIVSTIALAFVLSMPHIHLFFSYLLVTVFAFILHELAHKFVAIKFHCVAYYKMWPMGLAFGVFLSLLGFKVIAPGAVVIYPYRFGRWGYRFSRLTVPEEGWISLAGPATNLIIASLFYLIPGEIPLLIADTNAWIALFNLLPVPPLDGSKIMRWKPWVWLLSAIIAFLFVGKII